MNAWLSCIAALSLARGVGPSALVLAAPVADEQYVRDAVGEVSVHVKAGRYDQALAVLDEAERERPHPVFIYTRATIEELRGDCEQAAALYREYLGHDVAEADAQDARQGEARCREALGLPPNQIETEAQGEGAGEAGAGDVSGGEGAGEPVPELPPRPAWHTDPWGGVLVGGGLAGLGAGIGIYVQSRADERAAASATSLQSFEDRSRRAVRLNGAGIATMAAGSALLVGGVVRYALVATQGRRSRVTVGPGFLPRGGLARFTLRF